MFLIIGVGHSFGAHIMGIVGREVNRRSSGKYKIKRWDKADDWTVNKLFWLCNYAFISLESLDWYLFSLISGIADDLNWGNF